MALAGQASGISAVPTPAAHSSRRDSCKFSLPFSPARAGEFQAFGAAAFAHAKAARLRPFALVGIPPFSARSAVRDCSFTVVPQQRSGTEGEKLAAPTADRLNRLVLPLMMLALTHETAIKSQICVTYVGYPTRRDKVPSPRTAESAIAVQFEPPALVFREESSAPERLDTADRLRLLDQMLARTRE